MKWNMNVKVFHLKRKPMTVLACLLAAAAMFGAVNAPAVVASATQRQLPIYCVQRDQKMVSISFDAAWGNVILRQGDKKGAHPIFRMGAFSWSYLFRMASMSLASFSSWMSFCFSR